VTVFITFESDGTILVRARAEGPDGLLGDLARAVKPGEDFFGVPHAELLALGPGAHTIDPRPFTCGTTSMRERQDVRVGDLRIEKRPGQPTPSPTPDRKPRRPR
jgi:hypothetical protein